MRGRTRARAGRDPAGAGAAVSQPAAAGLAFVRPPALVAALVAGALLPSGTGAEIATVTVATAGGARVVEASLPGSVLGTAPAGGGRLAILAAPAADGPRSVFVLDPAGDGALELSVSDLSARTDGLGRLDGEVIVSEPWEVRSLGSDAASPPRRILATEHLDPRTLERRGLIAGGRIYQPLAGQLRIFGRGDGAELELLRQLELPVKVTRQPTGLRFENPQLALVRRPDAAWPLILAGPLAHGPRRLLTTVLDPEPSPSDGARERWSQLPAPETVDESFYLAVDGRPTLVVATHLAERLGLFERKQLRVFPLWPDRTRAGSPPTLAVETTSRRWQEVGVEVVDLDRDGRDDLAVVQRDGLGGKKLVVEVYPGKGNGGFVSRSRRSVVDAPDAVGRYGRDVTGDGTPDLVARCRGQLLVFPGREHRKQVLEPEPRWIFATAAPAGGAAATVTVGSSGGKVDHGRHSEPGDELRLVDLDGDGADEIVVVSQLKGRAVLRWIDLR